MRALTGAILHANQDRERRLKEMAREERRLRQLEKEARKPRDHKGDQSSSGSDSEGRRSEDEKALARALQGNDDQPFRKAARRAPGVLFADALARSRASVHQVNSQLQASRDGPVFRSWYETCFRPENVSKLKGKEEVLELLVIVLDEIVAGRIPEAADALASFLRFNSVGIDKGSWVAARQFLTYREREPASLVSAAMQDVADRAALKEQKRQRTAAKVNGGAGR